MATNLKYSMQEILYKTYLAPSNFLCLYFYSSAGLNKTLSTFNASAYVQYEFALTFDRMEACLEALFKLIDTKNFRANFTQDFRLPPNLRFVAEGNSYLATTNGGPRLFLNFDNYFESRSGRVIVLRLCSRVSTFYITCIR